MAGGAVANSFERDPEKTQQHHVLCSLRHVCLELSGPPALGSLTLEKPLHGAIDVVHYANSLAAASPLRTADSIVSVQPVSIHEPASARFGILVRALGRDTPRLGTYVAVGLRVTALCTSCASCNAGSTSRSSRQARSTS